MFEGSHVAKDDDALNQMRLHQECWELLPWMVNGRLSSADVARLGEHVRECTHCSEELHAQQQLCEAIRREDPVLLAPQASLKKLWQRFEAAPAGQDSLAHDPVRHDPLRHDQWQAVRPRTVHTNAHSNTTTSSVPPAHARARDFKGGGTSRRVRFALAAQALLIVGLLGIVSWQTFERWQEPRFMTLTSPTAVSERGGSVRVVFVATATVRDVNNLLRSLHAEILAGPNSAGVFTLGLPIGVNADAAALQLRNHPRVQFAESMVSAPVQP